MILFFYTLTMWYNITKYLHESDRYEKILEKDGLAIINCPQWVKYDKHLVLVALKQNIEANRFIPAKMMEDKEIRDYYLNNY